MNVIGRRPIGLFTGLHLHHSTFSSASAAVSSKKQHSADTKHRNNRNHNKASIKYFDISTPSRERVPPATILQNTKKNIMECLRIYANLSKMRLSTLVVLTTMAGYSISPSACSITSPTLLLAATVGTSLCITSANTINQLMEIEYDAKMTRTRNRILPSGKISEKTAWTVGITSGLMGSAMLYEFVNPLTAILGFGNILLYTGMYTKMKRFSVYNTHVGSVVGAIPPLMGWTAVNGGHIIGDDGYGGLLFAAVLFAWQFPHFNALSHNIRHEYLKGGYKMMANVDPNKNAAIALRWSAALFPICYGLSWSGITSDMFLLTSSVPNGYMLYYAYKFWKEGDGQQRDRNARKLFIASLFHLPAIVILMLMHKKHWYKTDQAAVEGGIEANNEMRV